MNFTADKKDLLLLEFVREHHAEKFIATAITRGDLFESAITGEPCKRNGLHQISDGDFVYQGLKVEIKYLTTKTKASKELKGTNATHYLIGFNNGKQIELRLINKNDVVYQKENTKYRIRYQDNYNKGVRVSF